MILSKPAFYPNLTLQDDHFRRFADLAFRHLQGAWEHHQGVAMHSRLARIENSDPRYGRAEHLESGTAYNYHQSEEYSHSCASILFSHVWVLSAANYYRLALKRGKIEPGTVEVNQTQTPKAVAESLDLADDVLEEADRLHDYRNTLMHLVEDDKKTADIGVLDFRAAHAMASCAWKIFCGVLLNYDVPPDADNWKIQTSQYSLPASLQDADDVLAGDSVKE